MRNYKAIVLTGILGAAVLTGCATWHRGDGDRTAGRVVDDKRITANVERGLANEPVYKFSDVDVRTYQGVVQLSGFVRSEDQKQRAGQIAENTPGVSRVVNSIVMKPEGNATLTPTGRDNTSSQYDNQNHPNSTNNMQRTNQ